FDRNQSYDIARDLDIPFEQFPCLVFLPPLTEISGQEKLIIPIKEVSSSYFRKIFSALEKIVKKAEEVNKYEAIKIKFDTIIQYLEKNSQQVVQQTTTKYQIDGVNIFVNSEIRRTKMTENNPVINIKESIIASVTGEGKIDTAIIHQHNSPAIDTDKATRQLKKLVDKLREEYPDKTDKEIFDILINNFQNLPQDKWKPWQNTLSVLFAGGKEAIKTFIPATGIPIAVLDRLYNIYQNRQQLPGS
ncbi:hypothetical protein, partial [Limnofasciculus baicalensis]